MLLPVLDSSTGVSHCSILMDMDTLQSISCVLNLALDTYPFELGHMARDVLHFLRENDRLRRGMIAVVNEDSGDIDAFMTIPGPGTTTQHITVSNKSGPVASILKSGNPIILPQAAEAPVFMEQFNNFDRNMPLIGVPVYMRGREPGGVLIGQPPPGSGPLEGHAKFLAMLATLVGQSLQIARTTDRERQALYEERDNLRRAVKHQHDFKNIVGKTEAMQALFGQVKLVAKWNTTVLIRGESGTGKELIANAIHYNSPRADGQFVKLNCAALPDNLLESELFGHEKGSFTGASVQRKGRFEQADGGTLFLDEIGEISPAFQAKLLRVLQEGEFERVGGTKTLKVDVRIIAATNRNLEAAVEAGNFREDLYYRLNVMPLNMPPLRERIEDIPELAQFLLSKIGKGQGRPLKITNSAIRLLMEYSWPGNVRELENSLERAAVMSQQGTIDRDLISLNGFEESKSAPRPVLASSAAMAPQNVNGNGNSNSNSSSCDDPELDERERVVAALEEAGWVQAKAARLLGMTPRQIAYRIQTLDIRVRRI